MIEEIKLSEFELMKMELENRNEFIGAILPGAAWITLKGNFTADELRKIADEINIEYDKIVK